MNLKTKVLVTLGPSSATEPKIRDLMHSGANIFRFNLKHNIPEWHLKCLEIVRKVAKKEGRVITTFFDLQGPSLRTGIFENDIDYVDLYTGDYAVMCSKRPDDSGITKFKTENDEEPKDIKWIPFDYIDSIAQLEAGHKIFLVDGLIELKVVHITKDKIFTKVLNGARLGTRKNMNVPEAVIKMASLTEKDKEYVKLAIKHNVDVIALSFVRDKNDVEDLRNFIKRHRGHQDINSKIETLKSLQNIDEIIDASDSITIARGDLGVEIPIERIPKVQKEIITKCRQKSKPVIVATQLLKSMTANPVPTRAEVADLANAVLDKTDTLWLSEETANGDYPVKSVNVLAKVAKYNEHFEYNRIEFKEDIMDFQEIIISASIKFSDLNFIADDHVTGAKGYIIFTETGKSARLLSRYRPKLPIYAFCDIDRESIPRKLGLTWGINAFNIKLTNSTNKNITTAINTLKKKELVNPGDNLIIIFGSNIGVEGTNNSLSIVTV